jgi:hypothetical protein
MRQFQGWRDPHPLKPTSLLQENKHFEDAFQAYERGVALFKYPHSKDIWVAYLAKFVARYGGRKLERARDLFRHALREVLFFMTVVDRPMCRPCCMLEDQCPICCL